MPALSNFVAIRRMWRQALLMWQKAKFQYIEILFVFSFCTTSLKNQRITEQNQGIFFSPKYLTFSNTSLKTVSNLGIYIINNT